MPDSHIHFVTYRQLVDDAIALVAKVPCDVTAVAGVPRSGMGPATVIATALHLPLWAATRRGLVKIGHGRRLREPSSVSGRCLIVDDSALGGDSMRRAVAAAGLPRERVMTAVVYAHPYCLRPAADTINIAQRVLPSPRFFEWNLLNHERVNQMMCDIDGVICREPAVVDDDGEHYVASLADAAPFHLPRRHKVHTLITHRLQRWQAVTRGWLERYGVQYENLIMAPQATAAQRRAEMRPYGRWKGLLYRNSDCFLFVESSDLQAKEIHRTSGKPVLCIESGAVYQ